MLRTVVLALCFPLVLSCSAGARSAGFDLSYPASGQAALGSIVARVSTAQRAAEAAVVVLVPPAPAQGFTVFELPSGRRLGQVGTAIDVRPVVLGDLVVAHAPGRVVAWGLDGTERWSLPDEHLALNGAARDGDWIVLTLGGNGVTRRDGTLVAVRPGGSVRMRVRVEHALGVPAVVGEHAFVPWDGQNLSVFELASGDEVARVRSRDDVIGFAQREGQGVFYGARALYRLAPESAAGTRTASSPWTLGRDDLPGNPPFALDGYTSLRAGLNARERVRVAFRADSEGSRAGTLGGVAYVLFYRVVFALDAASGAVRWGYMHPSDVTGIEAVRGGVVLADEAGAVAHVDARSGRRTWRIELGAGSVQASLRLPVDFAPPRTDEDTASSPARGLLEAAGGTDTRLLPARIFATRSLAAMDTPDATRALVELVIRRSHPPELRSAAGDALARRTQGTEAMVEALATHYDYVRQTEAPPVGLLAQGLAAARDRRAVAPLVAHLQDPATPIGDLPALVAALRQLADPAALPALLDFVTLYHADQGAVPPVGGGDPVDDRSLGDQDALLAALEQAAEAVAAMGGAAELRVLDEVLSDPGTPQALRTAIARVRGGSAATVLAAGAAANPAPRGTTFALPPARLTADMIAEAFAPHRDALLRCLQGAPTRPASIRIQFRYDSEGHISHVSVSPRDLQACMAPVTELVQLPASQVGREIGTYYVSGAVQ